MSDVVEIPAVRFTQREHRGVFLGRGWAQLVVAGAVVAVMMIVLVTGGWTVGVWLLPVAVPVLLVALWNWRGESLLVMISRATTFARRRRAEQSRYVRNVWDKPEHHRAPLPGGSPRPGQHVPEVMQHAALPGGLGDVQFVQIPGQGGFAYNVRDHVAAVTVTVSATSWLLRDDDHKATAADGFAGWLSGLEGMGALVDGTLCVRVDRSPSTELAEYAARRDQQREAQVSPELVTEYAWLVTAEQAGSMEFSSTIRLTFDTQALSKDIKDAGGGLTGLASILVDRVGTMRASLDDIDLKFGGWASAAELDTLTATGLDPVTASHRRERFGRNEREAASRPPLMGGEESPTTIQFDETVHRVMWVHEWPRIAVRAGFLQAILYSGESTKCVTIQVRPVPTHKALSELTSAQQDMDVADRINEKMGGRVTRQQQREREDLDDREEDLVDGFTDVRFRMFVTVSASTIADVRRDQSNLEQAAFQSGMRVAVMRYQQWPALVAATLPVPVRVMWGKK